MPVVADVHADLADGGVEDRPAEVAGLEVVLLPEALDLRDVVLAVLAEVAAVGVDHGRGVVVDPGLLLLVHGHHHDEVQLPGERLHPDDGRAVGDGLGPAVVLRLLDLTEVRRVEHLLESDHLRALGGGLSGVPLMEADHGLLVAGPLRLDEGRADGSGHGYLRNSVARRGNGPSVRGSTGRIYVRRP